MIVASQINHHKIDNRVIYHREQIRQVTPENWRPWFLILSIDDALFCLHSPLHHNPDIVNRKSTYSNVTQPLPYPQPSRYHYHHNDQRNTYITHFLPLTPTLPHGQGAKKEACVKVFHNPYWAG